MKSHNLWIITTVIQLIILAANLFLHNYAGAIGGLFGAFMCMIHRDKLIEIEQLRKATNTYTV